MGQHSRHQFPCCCSSWPLLPYLNKTKQNHFWSFARMILSISPKWVFCWTQEYFRVPPLPPMVRNGKQVLLRGLGKGFPLVAITTVTQIVPKVQWLYGVNHYWKMKTKSPSHGIQATRGATFKSTEFKRISRGKFHWTFRRSALSWLPITPSQCFLLLFLLLSSHPNCPIKEQPPNPTQAATKVIPVGSFKGKRTGKVWIPPLLPISDWGPRLVCVWIRLFLYARMKFPSWKKIPPFEERKQCFSKYVPQTILSRNALYQRLSLILNWFLDSQMCTVSLHKRMWLLSASSHFTSDCGTPL